MFTIAGLMNWNHYAPPSRQTTSIQKQSWKTWNPDPDARTSESSGSPFKEEKNGELKLAKTHEANISPAEAEMDTAALAAPDKPSPLDLLCAITNLNKNLDDRFANLSTQIQKLQSNVTETRTRLQSLETSVNVHDSRIDELESLCTSLQADNKYTKTKLEDLESRSRRQNIRIVGIPEGAEGGQPTDFIAELIPTGLGKEHFGANFKVDRTHRSLAAKPSNGAPPRPFIARLHYP
ncbi:hypothetical protein F2P81_005046 [Scophthalmus maximus]|uniref:Uncharacterized protein n=1 Tax=Scophthalmus maximus TaxID=52904 RepID=A0A6A4TFV7_SCOMX|nr:hypothetical protein F2P81_005046 [Scophthalmus maximus]